MCDWGVGSFCGSMTSRLWVFDKYLMMMRYIYIYYIFVFVYISLCPVFALAYLKWVLSLCKNWNNSIYVQVCVSVCKCGCLSFCKMWITLHIYVCVSM